MLHVAHVVHSLEIGGAETGMVNLVRGTPDIRHTVIAMNGTGPLAERLPREVPVHCLGKRPGLDLVTLLRLARLLRRLQPDIVHSRNWAAFDAVPAAWLVRRPVVIHGEHGREITDPHGLDRRRNLVRRAVAPAVARFVTVSLDLGRWLRDTVGIPADKVLTIWNGVDTGRFSEEGREEGRRALALPPDTVVIGTVGRLDPVKDQAGLLDAFARFDGSRHRAALVVIGNGPCRDALAARAARADLAGRVFLLGERRDVPLLLKGLDVYTLPSIAEGISNTVLEAMATGLPVVATRTGGNPELVEDGVTGRLVPVGDRVALADALDAYAGDGHLRTLHGKAARERAVTEFGLGRMVERYRALYQTLGAGGGP
ncbi:MAG: glycosyltransferase [Candidatus Rokubacteria bacterium]|nr:glycosyltransferase [Candidatus Rokubacteria bacterium]